MNTKIERLKTLPPDCAQELAAHWVGLLERLMGRPLDSSMMGFAAAYQNAGRGDMPARFGDKEVWDFMNKAMAFRQ